jgi:hypothetical protein
MSLVPENVQPQHNLLSHTKPTMFISQNGKIKHRWQTAVIKTDTDGLKCERYAIIFDFWMLCFVQFSPHHCCNESKSAWRILQSSKKTLYLGPSVNKEKFGKINFSRKFVNEDVKIVSNAHSCCTSDWIHLAHDRKPFWDLVKTAMSIQFL